MKKINLIYLAVIPVIIGVLYINNNYVRNSATFYGFAENKDTEINHDHPVQVNKIYVRPGQFVNKGDLLMEVTHSKFDLKMNELSYNIEALKLKAKDRQAEIRRDISQLETQRLAKVSEINGKIQRLQADIDFNHSLLKDLTTIDVVENGEKKSPNETKMAALIAEKELTTKTLDQKIALLKEELASINAPVDVEISKLEKEKGFYEEEERKLAIRAPKDGLIGNIHCLEGENKSSFATLMTFYERNPTLVKGYVHEKLIVHVNVGDTLEVSSSLHPVHRGLGVVIGLGSRIVEIPSRLRKIPEIKTYGREVLIQIPPENPFLQKEKVVLNLLNPDEIPSTHPLPIFKKPRAPKPKNAAARQ